MRRSRTHRVIEQGFSIQLIYTETATDSSLQKSQKRRAPLLLKRKALTTSFFDSSKIKSDGRKGSTSNTTSGLVFGQPLEKCLSNDNAFGTTIKQKGSDDSGGGTKLSRKSRASITSLDTQLPISSAISSDGNYVRSILCISQQFRNVNSLEINTLKMCVFVSFSLFWPSRAVHVTAYFRNMIHGLRTVAKVLAKALATASTTMIQVQDFRMEICGNRKFRR